MKTLLFAVALLVSGSPIWAAESPDPLRVILDQQTALKSHLDAGKAGGLTPRQLGVVRKAQKEVFAVSEGKTELNQLSIDEKVRLENALERINAEVKGGRLAKDQQEVCWRERMSGSQLKSTRCGTEAERREAREGARDFMEKPKVCVPPGCGG